jgi:hypothetical protein
MAEALRSRRTAMRRLLAAAVFAVATLVAPVIAPSAALAAPAAAPALAPSPAYLDQLLREINARRAMVGSPPVTYAGPAANLAMSQYLTDLTPMMQAYNACFHGMNNPVAPGWDYVAASGFRARVGGEVLGCWGEGFYWTPQAIADGWWNSPSHFHSLYGDASANAVACGAYAAGKGGRGYQTVACVTYRV